MTKGEFWNIRRYISDVFYDMVILVFMNVDFFEFKTQE